MSELRKTWTKLSDEMLQKTRVFDLHVQRMVTPDGKHQDDFYYIKTFDWVNIIPITPDGQVIFVEQYRHGINQRVLETPGGLVDKPGSDPRSTAESELREETGYQAGELTALGSLYPNPAMLTNRCHMFVATDVVPGSGQDLEPSEDITLHFHPLVEVPKMIADGRISHAVIVAAFFMLRNSRMKGVPAF